MFGRPKILKSQKPDSASLYVYRVHTKEVADYNSYWSQDYRQITVFDIGYENLCRRISRRYFHPKRIKPIAFDKTAINVEQDENGYRNLFQEISTWLDYHRQNYLETHVILIEWQLPNNYMCVRISTFILSYFHFLLRDAPLLPLLIEMRSGFKDDYYPVLKSLNQNARKSKCVEIGINLLLLQGDTESLEVLQGGTSKRKKKKQDDYADLTIMEETYCRYAKSKGWNFPEYTEEEEERKNSPSPPDKVVVIRKISSPPQDFTPVTSSKKVKVIRKNNPSPLS